MTKADEIYWAEGKELTYTDKSSGLKFYRTWCEYLGFEAWLSPGWISHSLLPFGLYERPVFEALRLYLRPGDTFADIGANIGLMSIFAHKITGGPIFAVEPEDRMRYLLKKNFYLAGIDEEAICSLAAGRVSAVGEITLSTLPAMTSLVRNFDDKHIKQAVQIEPIDNILPWVPRALKIDVEGYDLEALAGASSTLASMGKGSFVIVEPHPGLGADAATVGEVLRGAGFAVHNLAGDGSLIPIAHRDGQVIGFKL